MSSTVVIERLSVPAPGADVDELASILVEAVEGGAAVSFLAPLSLDVARAWWTKTLDGLHPGSFVLLARESDLVVGTVQMHKAWAPNQPHRGEIAKLLVRASHSGSGVGRMLMEHAEDHARAWGFSTSSRGRWPGNFRDLNASLTRMATLADGGRITEPVVAEEMDRLTEMWAGDSLPAMDASPLDDLLPPDALAEIDLFDRAQLEAVVRVCRQSTTLSDAGRTLFAASRSRRSTVNDSDRLRKYLARFDLSWESAAAGRERPG